MENNEKKPVPLTFIHGERIDVDNARVSFHGNNVDLAVLLAIIIKDLVSNGLGKALIYRAVHEGIKTGKKEKRGKK